MSSNGDLPKSRSGQDALSIAVRAAKESGEILKQHFFGEKKIENKGKRNLVTEVDLLSEKNILDTLSEEFPDHSILCEESGVTEKSSEYRWIIDPLDGTTNYAFGIPTFCVSMALTRDDDVIAGVIYNPLLDELFQAQKGTGAFLNGSRIEVSRDRNLQTTLIGFDMGYDDVASKEMISRAKDLWSPEISFRLIGSAALGITYVACGRLDIYFHRSIYPWDIASAILLTREAGGEVINPKKNAASHWDKNIIACSDINEHHVLVDALV